MKKGIISLAAAMSLMGAGCTEVEDNSTYGYLYCHMSDEGEWTAYALSRDGLNYHDLLDGKEVYDTKALSGIEGGARDAYISRSEDGKKYLMTTTDMCVRNSRVWYNYGMDLLRSDDLINWKSETFDFRKGDSIFCDKNTPGVIEDYSKICRVWAPQFIWDADFTWEDGTKGGYLIYYSLLLDKDNENEYDRCYYSHADRSFTKMTKPQVLFDWGYATIDADINYVPADGKYHMMIKKEGGKPGIFTSTADKLTGPWSLPVDDDYVNFEGNKKCEGPSAFQIEGEEGWRVAYIEYSSKPRHYRICKADKNMRSFTEPQDIVGVKAPQHGSFMRLTKAEYERLEAWGNKK